MKKDKQPAKCPTCAIEPKFHENCVDTYRRLLREAKDEVEKWPEWMRGESDVRDASPRTQESLNLAMLEALEKFLRLVDEKEWAGCDPSVYQQAEAAAQKARAKLRESEAPRQPLSSTKQIPK